MSGLNKVMIIGRLGKDPEIRHLEGGATVASFSVATSEKYTDKSGQKVENTEWHNIVAWNKLAEIIEKYVTKGMQVYIEGKIKTRSYDDKEGNKRYVTEIFANTLEMLSSGEKREQSSPQPQAQQAESYSDSNFDPNETDDLPF